MGHFSDLDIQEREGQLEEESNHTMVENQEKDDARRAHDASNRTITMQSKDNVWAWKKLIEDNSINGKVIWSFEMESAGSAPPILYEVNGKQYVSIVSTGGFGEFFGEYKSKGSSIYTFSVE